MVKQRAGEYLMSKQKSVFIQAYFFVLHIRVVLQANWKCWKFFVS